MKRDFLRVIDLTHEEVESLIDRAIALKGGADGAARPLAGRSVGLLFEKSSTRTRVSFEVGVHQLGGQPITLSTSEIQLGRGETVADTARVLSRYLHAVAIRTFDQSRIAEFAANATVPVINALTDQHHPCQALADVMTVRERKGRLAGLKMAYVGDGNNVAHSLVESAALLGFHLVVACPEGFEPDNGVVAEARALGGGTIEVLRDPAAAAEGADVLYTDVWVSMGQEAEETTRSAIFRPYQINEALLARAASDAVVLHCLPAHRGEEITGEVLDGPRSAVLDQAENRLHAQKALLEFLLR
jgi:ornithine carbamoyltransferase